MTLPGQANMEEPPTDWHAQEEGWGRTARFAVIRPIPNNPAEWGAGEEGMFSLKKRHTRENCLASI